MQSFASVLVCSLKAAQSWLFRQRVLPIDVKLPFSNRRSGIWLPAADADRVLALRDDRIPILRHHPRVAGLQVKVHLLTGAGIRGGISLLFMAKRTLSTNPRESDLNGWEQVTRTAA